MFKSFIARLGRFLVACRDASELALADCDRPLDRSERARLRVHRYLCGPCRIYQQQLEVMDKIATRVRDSSAEVGEPKLSGDAKSRLRSEMRARLKISGEQ